MSDLDEKARAYTVKRSVATPELKAHLSHSFGIPAGRVRDLGGSMNLNLLLGAADARWVVRVYMPYVTPDRLRDIQQVRAHLNAAGIPAPVVRPTVDGQPWTEFEGRLIEVDAYVRRYTDMYSWNLLEKGLPTLGRLHSLLADIDIGSGGRTAPACNHVEAADASAWTRRGTDRIRQWKDVTAAQLTFADNADALAEKLRRIELDISPRLPRQVVHGDYWDNNVFFRKGELVLVADFDFMGERARIDDIALTLFYKNSSCRTDTTLATRRRALRRLLDAYDSGLEKPLSSLERTALPLAMARTALAFVGMIDPIPRPIGESMLDFRSVDVAWSTHVVDNLELWQDAFL